MRAAIILASVALLAACNMAAGAEEGSGGGGGGKGQRTFDVGAFDRIALAGAHDVIVKVGGAPSVRAEGDNDVLERLEITVEGGELTIGQRKKWAMGPQRMRGGVVIHVTVPALRGASIAGSGDMRIDRVEGENFAGTIGGSGDLDIAALKAGRAEFSIAGSGVIRAAGTAQRSDFSIAGSGDIRAEALEAQTAKIEVIGSGNVEARATQTAEVRVMGSGDVTLTGGARCNVERMGSGSVNCGGA